MTPLRSADQIARWKSVLTAAGVAIVVACAGEYVVSAGAAARNAPNVVKLNGPWLSTRAPNYLKRNHPQARRQARLTKVQAHTAASIPLVFGIYPGGAAGAVGPGGMLKPEDSGKRLAALEQLKPPGRPFVLHLYTEYSGSRGWTAEQQVGQEVDQYVAAGFQIELVLTYRPRGHDPAANVAGFAGYVRHTIASFAGAPGFVSLQVTNEANVTDAPRASDGYYAGARDALIEGVIAAKAAARAHGLRRLRVGFNWANAADRSQTKFWSYLGQHGGREFARAVDWVGVDAYPGTWGPEIEPGNLAAGTVSALTSVFARLRTDYIPLARIPSRVALHVSENGFPTGPGRTETMQMTAMRAAIATVNRERGKYNITDYRWFDLRDADSASASFESHYGLLRDDYTPKPAFDLFRALAAHLTAPR